MQKSILLFGLAALGASASVFGAVVPGALSALMPVGVARNRFTPAQAEDLAPKFYDLSVAFAGGDVSLLGFLNYSQLARTAVIARAGTVSELEVVPDPAIGTVRFQTAELGDQTLDEHLADPRSRVQGLVVVQRGRIVCEQHPGMRPNGYHVWMSTAKPLASLVGV